MRQLKMNPLKCAFGVQSGLSLGFIVHRHGIEISPKNAQLNHIPQEFDDQTMISETK
jgi:hypothetical protein